MITDALLLFSDAQAITSTVESTNYVDLLAVRDLGTGENLYVLMNVDTAFQDASGSDSTITVTIETDDNSSFTSATTAQTLFTTGAVPAQGAGPYQARIDPGVMNERYARIKYTVNNGVFTAGAVTTSIYHDTDKQSYFASGFSVIK